jgi:ribosomal protein S18 acetylase RimI-like enzyme
VGSSTPRAHHSRIVIAPEGEVDAYAIASEWSPGEVHVDILGTRWRARGQGLGRDVLLAVIRGARDAGMTVVDLGVDASSPTGANRLYESVGFRPLRTHARWWRTVPARTGQT